MLDPRPARRVSVPAAPAGYSFTGFPLSCCCLSRKQVYPLDRRMSSKIQELSYVFSGIVLAWWAAAKRSRSGRKAARNATHIAPHARLSGPVSGRFRRGLGAPRRRRGADLEPRGRPQVAAPTSGKSPKGATGGGGVTLRRAKQNLARRPPGVGPAGESHGCHGRGSLHTHSGRMWAQHATGRTARRRKGRRRSRARIGAYSRACAS